MCAYMHACVVSVFGVNICVCDVCGMFINACISVCGMHKCMYMFKYVWYVYVCI